MSRRFSDKLTFNADYTWAKAIDLDDVDNDQNAFPDYTSLKPFYAPAGFDRRNVFNFQYVYNLPQFKGSTSWCSLPPVGGSGQGLPSSGVELHV